MGKADLTKAKVISPPEEATRFTYGKQCKRGACSGDNDYRSHTEDMIKEGTHPHDHNKLDETAKVDVFAKTKGVDLLPEEDTKFTYTSS